MVILRPRSNIHGRCKEPKMLTGCVVSLSACDCFERLRLGLDVQGSANATKFLGPCMVENSAIACREVEPVYVYLIAGDEAFGFQMDS
jgi:hypothetical protein